MANVLVKVYINELKFPVDGYNYNVSIVRSVDGGKRFLYCGCGKYCKTLKDVEQYINEIKEKENVIEVVDQTNKK